MFNIPTVDLIKTGENITNMRKEAGMPVKDLLLMQFIKESHIFFST